MPYKYEAGTPNIADTIALKAALDFVESKKGRIAIISSLENAKRAMAGETGTRIYS